MPCPCSQDLANDLCFRPSCPDMMTHGSTKENRLISAGFSHLALPYWAALRQLLHVRVASVVRLLFWLLDHERSHSGVRKS